MTKDKIEILNSIIDELSIESRKIEYNSEVERLKKRIDKLEEQMSVLSKIVKHLYYEQ